MKFRFMKFVPGLFISFLILSCSKDVIIQLPVHLSESIKPFKFMTGSYWIFQNDSTGTEDSIGVISTYAGFYLSSPGIHGQEEGPRSEYFNVNYKNFTTNDAYNDYLTGNYIKRSGGGQYGELGQPIFISGGTGSGFNGMEVIATFPLLTLNGITYTNVVETKITASQQYQPVFDNDTYLYFTDSIGLIRKMTDLGSGNLECWTIDRCNVIR